MRYKSIIALILVGVISIGLYAFASDRYSNRALKDVTISFTDYENPILSQESVNKLLIVNPDSSATVTIENIDLHSSETTIINNPMVRDAQVSRSLYGEVQVVVEPREPIARIMNSAGNYLDSDNKIMPLSKEHAVRVPLIYGFKESNQSAVFELLQLFRKDKSLKDQFTAVELNASDSATLRVRAYDFKVILGKLEQLENKLLNYKAVVAKLVKDKKLQQVKSLDLRFKKQAIVINK